MANTSVSAKSTVDNARNRISEWLEVKNIANYETRPSMPHIDDINWVYTPSGKVCACVWDIAWKGGKQKLFSNEYLFKFVDLVNKEYFEIKVQFDPFHVNRMAVQKVDCFYFSSEDELIIVAAYDTLVIQFVYKVDYRQQKMKYQETIVHKFMKRAKHSGRVLGRCFSYQRNIFVRCDGRDFVLLISNAEVLALGRYYHLYMIPMDPAHREATTQEFCFYFKHHFRNKDVDIVAAMGKDGAKYDRFLLVLNIPSCIICDTKLWFTLELTAFDDSGDGDMESPGTLIGAFGTVDLAKLKNIKEDKLATPSELLELLEKQEIGNEFLNDAVFHIAEKVHFCHFDKDVGFVNVSTNNSAYDGNDSALHLYQACLNEELPVILDTKLPAIGSKGSYTLHPHGALLNVVINDEGSIYVRVIKSLRLNLKSLALNKALFHKDTPIRHHSAYRLCFNGTKPMDYSINKDDTQI